MKTYTRKEIAFDLECSERVIRDDIKHLKIEPIDSEDYGVKIYSSAQFKLIKSLREHCQKPGKTRESFILPTSVEIVENPLAKHIVKQQGVTDSTKLFVHNQLKIDPFYDLELLQRLVDNEWLLPTKRLAAIININPKTLVRHDIYEYCGYSCMKIALNPSSFVWKVEKLS